MIEKIGTEQGRYLSKPNEQVIKYLEKMLLNNPSPLTVAEIGVGVGATSLEIVKRLREQDSYHFFSFSNEVDELYADLIELGVVCKLVPFGNSTKIYDSFCWPLAKLALEIDSKSGIYNLVFLDGAHNLNFTGLGCAILKTLIKPDGYFIFDDLHWSYGNSPNMNPSVFPKILDLYTEEQVNAKQVELVVDIFMERDREWLRIDREKGCAIYKRKPVKNQLVKSLRDLKKALFRVS